MARHEELDAESKQRVTHALARIELRLLAACRGVPPIPLPGVTL